MTCHSKYHSKKVVVDGIAFDSRKEARRYLELSLLEKAGQIQNLERQVKFVLIPAQYEVDTEGKRRCVERECSYVADFAYEIPVMFGDIQITANKVVEDTKGFKTKDYIIKRKLMLHVYGIKIKEV